MSGSIEAIRQGDLYALLSACSDDDLEPLVRCIVEAAPDLLESQKTYRKHRPWHSQYHYLIGDALRRCGATPAAGAARGEWPTYDDLVSDVCTRLDIPHQPSRTAENERSVLTLHLDQQLTALSPGEQAAIMAKAREEASAKATTIASTAREGASNLLSHAAQLRDQLSALSPGEQAAILGKARDVSGKTAAVATAATEKAKSLFSRAAQLGEKLSPSRSDEQASVLSKAWEVSQKAAAAAAMARDGAASIVSRAASGPLGRGVTEFSLSEPLFKVTIPCVLHLAYLRWKLLDRMSAASHAVSPMAPRTASAAGVVADPEARSATLVIGASEDKPVLSLARIPEPGTRVWHPVTGSDDGISRLNPLLQAVPAATAALHVSTTTYMEVVANGPLVQAAGGGFRGWVRGADGEIVNQARLFEAPELSTIVNAAALFQIVSVAVAQKHLADISRKLSDIKAAVDRIQRFQSNERRSVLTGAIRYFEQVAPAVLAGELSDGIRHQIEHHEAQLLQVQDHLLEDIRRESQEIMKVKDGDMFGSKGMQDAIQAHQDLLDDLYRQLLLCIRARACGWQLLVVFPGEERLKEARKRSIQDAVGVLDESGDLLKETDRFVREKVKGLSSFWNRASTLNERKLALLAWNETLVTEVASCKEQIGLDIRAAEAATSERLQPVKMLLRIEDGRVVAASAA